MALWIVPSRRARAAAGGSGSPAWRRPRQGRRRHGAGGERGNVGERHQRVLRGFDPQEVGARDRFRRRAGVGRVHPAHGEAAARVGLLEDLARAHVDRVRRHHDPADADLGEDRGARREPGRERDGVTAVERADRGLERRPACHPVARVARRRVGVQRGRERDRLVERPAGHASGAPGGDRHRLRVLPRLGGHARSPAFSRSQLRT